MFAPVEGGAQVAVAWRNLTNVTRGHAQKDENEPCDVKRPEDRIAASEVKST